VDRQQSHSTDARGQCAAIPQTEVQRHSRPHHPSATTEAEEEVTTKRSYECNFCCRAFQPEETIIGLEWTGNTVLRVRHRSTVENHICRVCFAAIRALPNNPEPDGSPSSQTDTGDSNG
jgi:hypothetical protein